MLKFKDGDKLVEVMFWHVTPHRWQDYAEDEEPKSYAPTGALVDAHGLTECMVLVMGEDGPEKASMGVAVCSRGDNFDRKVGRKISLTRALKKFDKSFRTMTWEQYLGGG